MSDISQTAEKECGGLQWTRDPSHHYLNYDYNESVAKSITIIQCYGDKPFRGVDHSSRNKKLKLFVDEHGIINRVFKIQQERRNISPTQEIFWGPGAEARVAWLLIDRAPAMKHEVWNTAQQTLYATPPHPNHTLSIIALIRTAELEERECWKQLNTLAPALALESIATLNLEVVLRYVCSLAGISPSEGDPMLALDELHSDLSDDVVVLQRIHHRIQLFSGDPEAEAAVGNVTRPSIQGQLERFEQVWAAIMKKLSPGRLANEMRFYADLMEEFVEDDRRYASQSDLEWAEKLAISGVRLYEAVHDGVTLFRKTNKGYEPA